jgi:S-DNA-T family DNA segregation ATPase FtsK/SpoIIIE
MLDWMRKLLNREESVSDNSAILEADQDYKQEGNRNKEVPGLYPNGKFRFPLIPDDKQRNRLAPLPFEEKQEEASTKQLQWPRTMPVEKTAVKQYAVQKQAHEELQNTVVFRAQQPKVKQEYAPSFPAQERNENRRPFRPTEIISPVFGYKRPSEDLWKKQPDPDLILSSDHLSVVDAWLLKNGYIDSPAESEVSEESFVEEQVAEPQAANDTESSAAYTESESLQEEAEFVFAEQTAEHVLEEQHEMPDTEAVTVDIVAADVHSESDKDAMNAEQLNLSGSVNELGEQDISRTVNLSDEQIITLANKEEQAAEESPAIIEENWEAQKQGGCRATVTEPSAVQAEKDHEKQEHLPKKSQQAEEPRREKKRFVPYNVVMLKQDKRRMAERQAIKEQSKQEVYEQKPKEPETSVPEEQEPPAYAFPSLGLLNIPNVPFENDEQWLEEQKQLLNTTFENFHVGAKVVHVTQGPAVTRFEVQPEPGVKVNKITNLSDDIKLNLAARDIRIEAPIPGKNAVGIEVPNQTSKPVFLREILRSPVFTKSESPLTVALGLDISGAPIVTDLRKMPHGLIAGATGSGKSVCINAILMSILYKAMPHEVKLLLIDPKMVELAPYNEVPHLVSPVITDVKAATAALKWAVDEMERRYELFAHAGARDLTRYNDLVKQNTAPGEQLPYIVIVIDELADLMMVSPADVEEAICRIAQKARACGIHLLVATQRPSVDVITGLIKANIPTRVAFTVSSQVDSRTIIDISGAEKLLGRGDMLFLENGTGKPVRVQGVYVSDEEIERTVAHVKREMKPNYLFQQEDLLAKVEQHEAEDELFFEACQFVLEQGGASTSSLQRRFRIGYNRAARLIEDMEMQGIISEARGTKPRDVLITEDELAAMQDLNG